MGEKLTGEALEQALKDRGLPSTGKADEKRAAVAKYDADNGSDSKVKDDAAKEEGTTTLDSHLDAPSVTAPGDGPADTTDPSEIASSASPDKAAAAKAGHGTVNAVVKTGEVDDVAAPAKKDQRVEKYKATKPDGTEVTVTHNIDTGATSVS